MHILHTLAFWSEYISWCGNKWCWLHFVLAWNICSEGIHINYNLCSSWQNHTYIPYTYIHTYIHTYIIHAYVPWWYAAWTEAPNSTQIVWFTGLQYFLSISLANCFSPTLGAFSVSTRHLQEGEGPFLIQKSNVSHRGSIESRAMFLRLGIGTSSCTPIVYHLSHTACSSLMAAFNVSAVPAEN